MTKLNPPSPFQTNKLVVVLGMHRSGTSAITRALVALGVQLGTRLEPPAAGINEKGYWEDIDIVALNVEMLNAINGDWHTLTPVQPLDIELLRAKGYVLRAVELLRSKLAEMPHFGFKDPRTAKMLPFWMEVFRSGEFDVHFVLAIRNPISVARSLAKRNGFAAEKSYLLWADHVVASLVEARGENIMALDYDHLMQYPDRELARLAELIGSTVDPVESQTYKTDFLDAELRHSTFKPGDILLDEAAPPLVREIYPALLDIASGHRTLGDQDFENQVNAWQIELQRTRSLLGLTDKCFKQITQERQTASALNEQIGNLNHTLSDRDQQVNGLNLAIADRDQQIVGLNHAVADRDQQIVGLNHAVADRDHQIGGLNQAVADRDQQIVGLNHAIADRDQQIGTLNQAIADRDQQIVGLNLAVAERDQQIGVLNQQLTLGREQTLQLGQEIAERDQEIRRIGANLGERDRQLSNAWVTIAEMRNSSSWRVTSPIRTVSSKTRQVIRVGGRIGRLVKLNGGVIATARKTVRVLSSEGIAGLTLRLRRPPGHFPAGSAEGPSAPAAPAANSPALPAPSANPRLAVVPHYLALGLDDGEISPPRTETVAIHLHLYYSEMLDGLAAYLNRIPVAFDLFVSVPESSNKRKIATALRTALPRAKEITVEGVPNRGRDLAPLIVQFGDRLAGYDVIAHLHTKKSLHCGQLVNWCDNILDTLFSSSGKILGILELLKTRAKIVYPEGNSQIIKDRTGWADNYELARRLLAEHTQLSIDDFPVVEFSEGSMFWARADCLQEFLHLPLTYKDFPAEPIPADGTLAHALERLILVFASQHDGQCIRLHQGDSIHDYRHYEEARDYSGSITHSKIKVLSYYLPQFHPIPENDEWHGEGFTEWTKVKAANPLFEGHYQQHIPHPDIGYYFLDSPDTLRRQAELMRQAGVHGQVFYHYWFSGKLILEEPARMLLDAPDIEMPFCFCWANENWTRRWDGNEHEILLGQEYSADDAHAFIRHLIPFFRDPRYLSVDGRPMLFVYRPSSIPNPRQYLEIWEEECRRAGLKAPYVVAVLTRGATHPDDFGMDAGVERVLHDWTAGAVPEIKHNLQPFQPINGSVLPYPAVSDFYAEQTAAPDFTYFRSLVPIWDNTARYGSEAFLLHGSTPALFQRWLESTIRYTETNLPEDRQFVLVNAWNEWAEGAHLEPDTRFGYSYLNGVGRALSDIDYAEGIYSRSPLPSGIWLHLSLPDPVLKQLRMDQSLKERFIHCLAHSSIFKNCFVSIDPPDFAGDLPKSAIAPSSHAAPDFTLQFRRVALFDATVIERMIQTAMACPGSVVLSNAYDQGTPLAAVTENGSVETSVVHEAPLVLFPADHKQQGYKNFRMRTDAHSFVARANNLPAAKLPAVTTIIRFHKSADLAELKNALYSLLAMQDCIVVPLIAAQDLSATQKDQLRDCLNTFPWRPGFDPVVDYYDSPEGKGDLRSRMLNESLRKVKTRYAAFLDYDDRMLSNAYPWLLDRLRKTGKAVSFGRVYSSLYDGTTGLIMERKQEFQHGHSYDEFLRVNHAPLHSMMLDCEQLDLKGIVYFDDQRFLEDYVLTLQLFTQQNCDWESLALNAYIGDYIHSVHRAHTLAFTNLDDRTALLASEEYQRCEQHVNDIKNRLAIGNKSLTADASAVPA